MRVAPLSDHQPCVSRKIILLVDDQMEWHDVFPTKTSQLRTALKINRHCSQGRVHSSHLLEIFALKKKIKKSE